ncbi:MAG: sugar ABC transporter ATP-binding protein [Fusobacteriaceae bacterium]
MENKDYVLEAKNLSKSFSGIEVLKNTELCILPGELHALMGENGAGKSTLMKIIMGIYSKDSGEIKFNGNKVNFSSAKEALDAGISMIHQELSPIPEMTVSENIFLGREEKIINGLPFVDKKKLEKKTQVLLDEYNLNVFINPKMKMKDLNIAQIQMMEIVKAISYDSRLIIMDEPTSSLSDKEAEVLFKIIDDLKNKKIGIIYISHRMEEVFKLSDRISVLRDGKFIGCVNSAEATPKELINMMVGRELNSGYPKNTFQRGKIILELKNFSRKGFFKNINLKIHSGEILGLAGLVGAGRSEVMRALVGYDKLSEGEIILEGNSIKIKHPKDAIKNQIIMASEDRKELGLILSQSIKKNIAVQNFNNFNKFGFISKKKEATICQKYAEQMSTKMNGINDLCINLSGGNQQKVVLAKCMLSNPKVLIMDEPTRGIDVGAKAKIYNLMQEMTKQGIAIIMISSEMPELIGMSDKIIVMSKGEITGELKGADAKSQQLILKLALGGRLDGK